jgi:hypothetical protein
VDASCIWLLAERKGLKLPKLTEKQDAAVARRETIGLVEGVDPRPKSRDGKIEPDLVYKRHEILNRKLYVAPEQCLALFNLEFAARPQNTAPGQPLQHVRRESNLNNCVLMAILEHAGYGPIEGLSDRLNYGMDWALEYYFGDWYRDDEAQRDYGDKIPEPRRLLLATGVFWQSLFFGGLTGRWADVEHIAGWYNGHVDLASQAPLLEPFLDVQLQLAVAASLAPAPIPGAETLVARIQQDDDRHREHLRFLFRLWEAALAKDQPAFDKALKDKLKSFLEKQNRAAETDLRTWVDLYASAIWLIAERNGLAFPKLREKQDAAIVRRQTVGLA